MEQNFDLGPGFRALIQNWPKIAFRPIWGLGVSSLTAAVTFKQGHRLFSVFLMLRGSSAHSINDRPSHWRVLKTHRNVFSYHAQKRNAAEFWIFALKVKYQGFRVKHWNTHLTAFIDPQSSSNWGHRLVWTRPWCPIDLKVTRLKSRSLRSSPFLPILHVLCNLTL